MSTMSDTPLSDKNRGCADRYGNFTKLKSCPDFGDVVALDFARQLERELNATRQAFCDYMTKAAIELEREKQIGGEYELLAENRISGLERELNDLRHENGNLRQHIELLKASK